VSGDAPAAVAVIIGRAGSRGLPGKNGRVVAGRPMIAWSVAHALACPEIGSVLVSTDGAHIAAAAREAGAAVVMRPADIAGDHAPVIAAVRHAMHAIEAGEVPEIPAGPRPGDTPVVILYANVPVRPAGLAGQAVRMLRESGADSVQSYADVGKHHPAWMVRIDAAGRVAPLDPAAPDRRQDLEPLRLPDGGVIAVRRDLLEAGPHPHAFLGRDRRGIVTAPGDVVDVDDAADLAVAEARLRSPGG
jgi:N-acylneuraminate cytidylyltransferase